jgi:hypothetical protein
MSKFVRSQHLLVPVITLVACADDIADEVDPPPPVGRVSARLESDRLVVTWSDAAPGVERHVIARLAVDRADAPLPPESFEIIGAVSSSEPSTFEDPFVDPGLRYAYAVASESDRRGRSAFVPQEEEPILVPIPGGEGACGGPPTADDRDGDGLTDAVEADGWSVTVDEDGAGTTTTRQVAPDPLLPDTDGDGLCDREENTLRTDPRQSDTDVDGLEDRDEVNRWGSSPTNVDSDGDASGNGAYFDGGEALIAGTSPTLADTDGDGRSDFEELNQDATNPLLADLPKPRLRWVGEMDVDLDTRREDGSEVSNAVSHRYETTRSRATEETSSSATQTSVETSKSVTVEANASYPFGGGVDVTVSGSQTEGYVEESGSSLSSTSMRASQDAYEEVTTRVTSFNEEILGGRLGLNLEILNAGTRTFELSGLVVTALRRSPSNPARFTPVTSLALPEDADGLVLGEGEAAGPFLVSGELTAREALDLLANPSALVFRTANVQLTDRTGEAFEFRIGEETNARTALVTIDYGGFAPLERYRVATNVERGPDGRPVGIRLADVLERIVGLTEGTGYATATDASGREVLTRVRGIETQPNGRGGSDRFWLVMAAENPGAGSATVEERILDPELDFGEQVLLARDAVYLTYVTDRDGDGLIAREERAYGISDLSEDFDDDGLTDFEEVREGWPVEIDLPFYTGRSRVFSSPASIDVDDDGLTDPEERDLGTDPNRSDSDGDGLLDPDDPEPTVGPSGDWLSTFGTSEVEEVWTVETSSTAVIVLGHSEGDLDGDGTAGGPFVSAVRAADGRELWTEQIEGATDVARGLVADDSGVRIVAKLTPGALPDATRDAIYVVRWGLDGTLSWVRDQTDADRDWFRNPGEVDLLWVGTGPGGKRYGLYTRRNSPSSFDLGMYEMRGNGGLDLIRVYRRSEAPTLHAATTDGDRFAFSWEAGPTCGFVVFPGEGVPGLCVLNIDPQRRPAFLGLDQQQSVHAVTRTINGDTYRRVSLGGNPVHVDEFSEFVEPQVTAFDVGRVDQHVIAIRDRGRPGPTTLRSRDSEQSLLWEVGFGNASVRVNGIARSGLGDLFIAGTSDRGFDDAPAFGGDDIFIIRNPQIRFEEIQ